MARTKQTARRNSPPPSISIRAAIAAAQAMEQAAECDRERAERDREREEGDREREEGDRERATGDREREEGDRERTEQCPFCGVEGVHVCAGQTEEERNIFGNLGPLNPVAHRSDFPYTSTEPPTPSKRRRKASVAELRRLYKRSRPYMRQEEDPAEVAAREAAQREAERKAREDHDAEVARKLQEDLEHRRNFEQERDDLMRADLERRKKFRHERQPWEQRPRPPPPPPTKRKYKFKPGTCALREIRKYQKSTDPILPRAPFSRVVREMIDQYANHATRVQSVALDALRDATEDIATSLFQDGVLCHVHAKRVTLKPVELSLAIRLCQDECLRKN